MNYAKKRELILNGDMRKVIMTLAVPIMFTNLVQTLYNLADTYWVSKIGYVEMSATNFVWPVLFLMIALGLGVTVAGTSLISQYVGSDQNEDANLIAGQIFSFSLIMSVVLAIIGFILAPHVIKLMGANEELFAPSNTYLRIMFLDVPVLFIYFVFNAIKQSQGDTLTPMLINVISVILNVILDPLFILVFDWGIAGAAIATVLSKFVFTFYILYSLFHNKSGVHLTLENLKIRKEVILKVIKIGIPASLGQSGAALGFIFLNHFIVDYGNITFAAFGIGNKINSLVMMPAMGIGSALAAIIGQNLGANQIDRAKNGFKTAILISIILMGIGGSILFLFAGNVIKIFVPNKEDFEVVIQGKEYLKIMSAAMPLMGIFQVLMGTFQGSGHTVYSMILDMGRLWCLRLPMIVIFKNFTNWGSTAVWYAMVSSNLIICIVGMIIYSTGKWQKQVIHKKALTSVET
jgi:MATE family, multidrug efflux pump